ncbi:hypothetical protein Catovirus_1_306 [Catovirus CTV1]|uniref:Uncharacterized protein n=1 Tax=Catovirus CTV1 TaxID=1977631 RepID=A0A1V0S967_9VIRU|nr:hypothetical protein Catovirus_1_306 [Catovirus CTV1]
MSSTQEIRNLTQKIKNYQERIKAFEKDGQLLKLNSQNSPTVKQTSEKMKKIQESIDFYENELNKCSNKEVNFAEKQKYYKNKIAECKNQQFSLVNDFTKKRSSPKTKKNKNLELNSNLSVNCDDDLVKKISLHEYTIDNLTKENQDLLNQLHQAIENNSDNNSIINSLTKQLEEKELLNKELKISEQNLIQEVNTLRTLIDQLQSEKHTLENKVKFEGEEFSNGEIINWQKKNNNNNDQIEELNNKLRELETEITHIKLHSSCCEARIDNMDHSITRLRDSHKTSDSVNNAIIENNSDIQRNITKLIDTVNVCKFDISVLNNKYNDCIADREKFELVYKNNLKNIEENMITKQQLQDLLNKIDVIVEENIAMKNNNMKNNSLYESIDTDFFR